MIALSKNVRAGLRVIAKVANVHFDGLSATGGWAAWSKTERKQIAKALAWLNEKAAEKVKP